VERIGLGHAHAVAGPHERYAQGVLPFGQAILVGFGLVLGVVGRCGAIAGLQSRLGDEQIAVGVGEQFDRLLAPALGLVLTQERSAQVTAACIDGNFEEVGHDLDAPTLLDPLLVVGRRVGDAVVRRRAVIALVAGHGSFRRIARGGFAVVGRTLGGCRCGAFTLRTIVHLPALPDQQQEETKGPVEK
jgi:hypothetical protein